MRIPGRLSDRAGTAGRVIAALLVAMHALVVAAPLAERADSTVAAVHVEQAGTSTHHAHGELCALCAASHLVAPPARASESVAVQHAGISLPSDRADPWGTAGRLVSRSRAPPV
ncbi:MAG TPA: hypothetical protein VFU01_02775 [Gemmatimonadaceae bacterium]|nr:hypothetical protein [Gemmatimonadaceae bacterium]